ncbi:two-component sensor histidine kinase [Hahella sp. CCB-MM4]|uniref:ATP-binding protein n=1 Tax=Hahella sp. (strain CCB-MM4) TaxID=1926491 RepID=UPI000B9B27FE|nr:ATP-binding protein [Hahella sp. CCB-MM4]OZG71032.1 two-component sensor histidine kinase [Hahella sp. CCB-MM4]
MKIRVSSIKRFLLISISALIIISGLITLVTNYAETHEQVEELFDAELAQMSRLLQSILANQLKSTHLNALKQALVYEDYEDSKEMESDEEHYQEYNELGHKYEKKLAFQVWHENGQILIHTQSAKEYEYKRMPAGFHDLKVGDSAWRTFTLHDPQLRLWIQVAQRADVRSELTQQIALQSLWPSLALIVLLVFGISWVVTRGLLPLGEVSSELKQRSADNLSTLPHDHYPEELRSLVSALNDLFTRLQKAMERERRFTADAAHELRTPLAATKVHLENATTALKSLEDSTKETVENNDSNRDSEREKEKEKEKEKESNSSLYRRVAGDSIDKALTGLQRLIHMVEQLLQLSRLDQENAILEKKPVQWGDLVNEEIAAVEDYAKEKGIDIAVTDNASSPIEGNPGMLRILLRNLLDNAIRYSPSGSQITIVLRQHQLIIEDQGPGIPSELREQMFERFFRGKATRESGSGLGLSISLQIAELHGATLTMSDAENGPHGLRMCLDY